MMHEKFVTYEIESDNNHYFGETYEFTCPNCGDLLVISKSYLVEQNKICSCNIEWKLDFRAIGRRAEK